MSSLEIIRGLPGKFGGMRELENEPPVEWLIKGWLASNELTVLYGKGGSFKSYIALGWTLQLSEIDIPSLYIAAEGTSGLRARVDAWMASRGLAGSYLDPWGYYNANVHLDDAQLRRTWMEALKTYLDKVDVKLIVVDTLARNFAGDESSPKEMGQFIEGVEEMRRQFGCAILVVHHMGVNTGRERGSEALRNATFAMYKTSDARLNGELGGGSVLLECDRMKDAPMPDGVRVHFDTVALDIGEYGEALAHSQAMRNFPPKKGERPKTGVIDAT